MRWWVKPVVLLLAAHLAVVSGTARTRQPALPASTPTDDEIRSILVKRIDVEKQSVGIVAGVIDAKRRRIVSHGRLAQDEVRPLGGDTVFEIGSVTKVFSALLLTDMAQKGELALTDPISKYLPDGTTVPQRGGQAITLQDLAMHTSGLPRMPNNFAPADPLNPYADYGFDRLTQFLSGYTLTRDVGAQYEYSNLGGGLLGTLLARRAGLDYEALVAQRISKPLAMTSTAVTLTATMKARLATGHNARLEPTPNWDFPPATSTLTGAGGLRSTANDLLNFVAAALGLTTSPLARDFEGLLATRRPTGRPNLEIALGWHVTTRPAGKQIVWHNGGTGGYRSFVGYDSSAGIGVVVLSNAFTPAGVDDIGMHLLDATVPLWAPPVPQVPKGID